MGSLNDDVVTSVFGVVALLTAVIFIAITYYIFKSNKTGQKEGGKDLQVVKKQLPEAPEPLIKKDDYKKEEVSPVDSVRTDSEKPKKLSDALAKTEEHFFGRLKRALSNNSNIDKKAVLDEVEEVLYTSDLGSQTVEKLLEVIKEELGSKEMSNLDSVKNALKSEMTSILKPHQEQNDNKRFVSELMVKASAGPTVLMIVGVNGAGKTTSIGKMAAQLASQDYRVLVAAGDTFRAAAGGQLKVWTERAHNEKGDSDKGHVEIYWPENTTDPSAVAYEALTKAKSQNYDFVLIDTAGRLHTQAHLMEELKKVKRVMTKVIPEAPHETWIVLDANSGQNALIQAKEYHQALALTGVILTKMDGTAKGGVALAVVDQIKIPIKLIGIGEKIQDLRVFNHKEYTESVLGIGV